jgi:hypothetical protein
MKEVYGKHLACTVVLAIIWLIIVTKRDEDINLNPIAVKINSAITSLEKQQQQQQQQQQQKPFESCDVLDFSEPIKCGGCKCFVPSKQSAAEGYLVLHDNCIDTGLANMEVSYELATKLKYKFEIKHTLLEPPVQLDPNQTVPLCIRESLDNTENFISIQARAAYVKYEYYFEEVIPSGIIYQKNIALPTPHFLIKLLNLKDPIDFINDYVENATKFLENFDDDAERMANAFRYEKGLFEDLQVVMDSSGQLYHLDFDRFYWGGEFRRPSEERINKIAKKMGNYFYYIRKLAKLKAKGLLDEYIEENYSSDSEDSDDGDE